MSFAKRQYEDYMDQCMNDPEIQKEMEEYFDSPLDYWEEFERELEAKMDYFRWQVKLNKAQMRRYWDFAALWMLAY